MNKIAEFLSSFISLFAACGVGFAADTSCAEAPLVEIRYDAFGMISPQGPYLYFRACNDRRVEYEVDGATLGTKVVRTQRLTVTQISSLRALVGSAEFRHIAGTYGAKRGLDYSLTLRIRASRGNQVQSFTLQSLPTDEGPDAAPEAALRLLCMVDEVRRSDLKVSRGCAP
jgi:hypothetical protein